MPTRGLNEVDGRLGPPSRFTTVLAFSLGNAIEIYDFTVYSFFSLTIGRLFFPVQSEFGPLLLALLTFGVGFVVRPLGGIVIGAYADRAGRKPALVLTISLMALGTLLIGLCPTYADIGLLAPALIVVGRCLQGFSAGGEIGVATTLLMEMGRPSGRGLRVSWQMASQGAAALCGALSGYILTTALPPGALEAGAWRIPFLVGLLIIPVGLYVRWSLPETVVGGGRQAVVLRALVNGHGRTLFAGVLMIMGGTASTYVNIYYMPTYLIKTIALPPQSAFLAGCFAGATLLIVAPLSGRLSDRLGRRRPFVFWSWLGTAVLTYPAFWVVVQTQSATAALVAFVVLIGFNAAGSGSCLIVLMENFPRGVRATGLSVVYSVGVSVFGGFAPFVVTWLISVSGNPMSPAWYVMACATAALFGVTRLRERPEPEGAVPVQS